MGKQSSLFGDHENCAVATKAEAEALRKAVETPLAPHEPINDGYHPLRAPCPDCGCKVGRLKQVSNQLTVRCENCDRFAFNAPRAELGLPNAEPEARVMASKWAGACRECGQRFVTGERVAWTPKRGTKCLKCHGGVK